MESRRTMPGRCFYHVTPGKYVSIITNFGCHYTCPECVVKNNGLKMSRTDSFSSLEPLNKALCKEHPEWLSISGGGDPLFNWKEHWAFYEGLFRTAERRHTKLEMHTSCLPDSKEARDFPFDRFERIVYHVHTVDDLLHIKRQYGEIVRVVFVVDDNMTERDVLFIAGFVRGSSEIDELSFRQRVDEHYKPVYHLYDLMMEYHKQLWWYIEQDDYNIYYHNGKLYTRYRDIFTEGGK